jgi:hypothetical protein
MENKMKTNKRILILTGAFLWFVLSTICLQMGYINFGVPNIILAVAVGFLGFLETD